MARKPAKAKSIAALKGWETRRANIAQAKRVAAALKGAETKRRNKAEAEALKAKRSAAAKKAWATRKAKALKAKRVAAALKGAETRRRNKEKKRRDAERKEEIKRLVPAAFEPLDEYVSEGYDTEEEAFYE